MFHKVLTRDQRDAAEKRLVFACIQNGWSYNSMQRASLARFLSVVRGDFVAPSRYRCGALRDELLAELTVVVMETLQESKYVSLAFDGWTNHAHAQTIAVAATTAKGQTLLLLLREMERETAEAWGAVIKEVVDDLLPRGVRVIGTIADNANNAQRYATAHVFASVFPSFLTG